MLCAEPKTISYILQKPEVNPNIVEANDGNTPLHLSVASNRADATALLLQRPDINDNIANAQGQLPVQLARSEEVANLLQSAWLRGGGY